MAALVRFLAVFLGGLAAAAAIGELVPHVKWMAARFDVSLAASGFLVSAVMLPGVVCGPLLGVLVDRLGARRIAVAGLAIEAAASFALPYAADFAMLAAVRIFQGVGYSLAIVAATVLVVDGSTERRRALALAVWSAFAPVGFAIGQWLAGGVRSDDPLPVIGSVHALVLLGAGALIALAMPRDAAGGRTVSRALFFAAACKRCRSPRMPPPQPSPDASPACPTCAR